MPDKQTVQTALPHSDVRRLHYLQCCFIINTTLIMLRILVIIVFKRYLNEEKNAAFNLAGLGNSGGEAGK